MISLSPKAGGPPKFNYFGQFPGIKVVGIGAAHYHTDAHIKSNLELNLVLFEARSSSSFPKCAFIGVCHSWGVGAQSECVAFCRQRPLVAPCDWSKLALASCLPSLIGFLLDPLHGNNLFLEEMPVQTPGNCTAALDRELLGADFTISPFCSPSPFHLCLVPTLLIGLVW